MIFRLEKILRDVRVALDMNDQPDALLPESDTDTLTLEQLIASKVTEAVRRVHMAAPTRLLEYGHNFGEEIQQHAATGGWILLPDDFMRLVSFRMSDWTRALDEAAEAGSVSYKRQRSEYGGIRGSATKPACSLTMRPEGLALEYHGCRSVEAYVAEGVYMPLPTIDADGGVDISRECYRAVVYMTAALVQTSFGDGEKAKTNYEMVNTLLDTTGQ